MQIGVAFSRSYCAFLQRYGWARLGFDTIFGLGEASMARHRDVRHISESERSEMFPRTTKEGEHPVVFWNHEG
jgi:hypothetical protein